MFQKIWGAHPFFVFTVGETLLPLFLQLFLPSALPLSLSVWTPDGPLTSRRSYS